MLSENSFQTFRIFKFNILKWLRLQKQIMQFSAVYNFIGVRADYVPKAALT